MIASAWNRIKKPTPGWYWICDDAHYGDLYQVAALAPVFREHFGSHVPLYLVATSKSQADVGALFPDCFAEIIVEPSMKGSFEAWRDFYEETRLPSFGVDSPLVVWAVRNPEIGMRLWQFAVDFGGLGAVELQKFMLHLPASAEPRPCPVIAERVAQALALCRRAGMVAGRSVILCPYARSDHVSAEEHFASLAAALRAEGYAVFTSTSGSEQAIVGTAPIHVPFFLLPDVADHAGWIIAVRSGICDIVCSSACRKTFIYSRFDVLTRWNLAALGLGRDAQEIVFNFGFGSPAAFVASVMRGDGEAGLRAHSIFSPVVDVRPTTADDIRRRAAVTTSTPSAVATPRSPVRRALWRGRAATRPKAPSGSSQRDETALIVCNLPSHRHPRMSSKLQPTLAWLGDRAIRQKAKIVASRDRSPEAFVETFEASDLTSGNYYLARFWHTIALLTGPQFEVVAECFPTLPEDCVSYGVAIRPGHARSTASHRDVATARIPFCHGGIQFLDGWASLEAWGLWSLSCASTMKINLPDRPTRGVSITVTAMVSAFSDIMPSVAFQVFGNHHALGRFELKRSAELHRFDLVLTRDQMGGTRSLLLDIVFPRVIPASEQDIGSADQRLIGLGIHEIVIDAL